MGQVLIVDDEASICWALREFLTDEGHHVDVAASAEEGLRLAEARPPDAVVIDVRLPGMDGLTALGEFQTRAQGLPIVVMTAFGNLDTAVRAMEGGAFDYLVKPFDLDQAAIVVRRALEAGRETASAASAVEAASSGSLIGSSASMQALFRTIALVAPTNVPVLITGESGTGKELVARAIHRHGARRSGPFVPISVPALSPSLVERELFGHIKGSFTGATQDRKGPLELATGGTVLLDEIGDVPPAVQVKLLRAIEHREVTPVGDARPRPIDVRFVAATNRPMVELLASGQFREDLFFRLSVFEVHLPPLRERLDDVPALAEHFLRQARLSRGDQPLDPEVVRALQARSWTGNVRELRNAIEYAAIVARGQPIRPEHLPAPARAPSGDELARADDLGAQLAAWSHREAGRLRELPDAPALYECFLERTEPHVLRAVLSACGNNRAQAARVLGIHRATLREKLKRYKIW
jgi:two-component system nitrogen regulation response regulator GlnG